MANRLTRITTRTGDDGSTGLADGSRLLKSAPAIHLLGELDELNACLGWARAQGVPAPIDGLLLRVQSALFEIGSEVAAPGYRGIDDAAVAELEDAIAAWNAELPALREFLLPGGAPAAAAMHLARTVCRRAERALVTFATECPSAVGGAARRYLNRLSDLLFIAARLINRQQGVLEPLWQRVCSPAVSA
jgi:cob(I)alamin adenosyltransferase